MASEMFVLRIYFCLKLFPIFAQEIVDFNLLSEFLDAFESSSEEKQKVIYISYRVS